ncbi:hypothetical protein L2E82_14733 [Cichorium intybus]|uniref:Uncharacterized protein n=1 Tax=Cichorium intybus TaxID=13427 RepID=A0ACB9F1G0_CICIN|nr:hypothetical protein L2E82_14733 [Cichorium intybus]
MAGDEEAPKKAKSTHRGKWLLASSVHILNLMKYPTKSPIRLKLLWLRGESYYQFLDFAGDWVGGPHNIPFYRK